MTAREDALDLLRYVEDELAGWAATVAQRDGAGPEAAGTLTEIANTVVVAREQLEVHSQEPTGGNPRSPDLVPETIRRSLLAYAHEGTPVGGFLEAVLTGDLYRACRNADGENVRCIPAIVAYCDSELPGGAFGSPKAYGEWIEMHAEIREGKRCPECFDAFREGSMIHTECGDS